MKITKEGIAVLDDDKDSLLSRWVERDGRLDHDESLPHHYLRHIKAGDVVVDGGAAIGDHTIAYIRACGDAKLVHAFEPNPLMVECLSHNCPECHIHPYALSDSDGAAWLAHDDSNAGAAFSNVDGNGVPIETRTLDSFEFPKVDFIKLDLEGFEGRAILGATATLRRCKPRMVLEMSPWMLRRAGSSFDGLLSHLKSIGYDWNVEMGEMPALDGLDRAEFFFFPR